MARQRRGGFKPPELGTLGTLLRTTLHQAGVVRDALSRGAREGRSRLDNLRTGIRSSRQRQEALAELGEIVLELIRRGEIDVAELPEARDLIEHIDELDANEDASADAAASEGTDRDGAPMVSPSTRKRFDDRPAPTGGDDGTVSSNRWAPPPRRPGKATKIWKPAITTNEPADEQPPTSPGHKALPARDANRKGGIQFEDSDDDLADYMHPDDVPPKPKGD